MKTLDLDQLVDLAQRLRQAFPDESPVVKRVEKAINKKLDECLSEGLTWYEADPEPCCNESDTYFTEELIKENENPLKDYLSTLFRFSWTGKDSLWTIPTGTTNNLVEAIVEFAPDSEIMFIDFNPVKNKFIWSFPGEEKRGSVYVIEVGKTFPNEGMYRFNLLLTTDKPFKTQD